MRKIGEEINVISNFKLIGRLIIVAASKYLE